MPRGTRDHVQYWFLPLPNLRRGTVLSNKFGSNSLLKALSLSVCVSVNSSICQCKHWNQWSYRIWKFCTKEILCWQSIKMYIVKINFYRWLYYLGMALHFLTYNIKLFMHKGKCAKATVSLRKSPVHKFECIAGNAFVWKKLKETPEKLLCNMNRQSKRATWQSRERKRTVRWNIKVEQSQLLGLCLTPLVPCQGECQD